MPENQSAGPLDIQFQHAELLPAPPPEGTTLCAACRTPFTGPYFHAQGQVVCPKCAELILSGQQKAPPVSLLRAALYGAGAALAGCAIYATIALLFNLEIGLVAILIGFMVGKAVRHGSRGLGGRPQQILAVLLTYFAITTSYIPVFIAAQVKKPAAQVQAQQQKAAEPVAQEKPRMGIAAILVTLVLLAAAAPFFSLTSVSGLIGLFIIFIGLQRAWRMTGRTDLLGMGPYEGAVAE